ncbi:nucleolar and spindle-associated protein 1 [Rhynchonycteris naso]
MIVPSVEELNSLKYSDLQNLAKSLGLRANLRAGKLLKALKAHLKQEARKENENQDESQNSASSCDETKMQTSNQKLAEREPAGCVTKTRRRHRAAHRNPDFQQGHLEIKTSDLTEFQNQEKQENQTLGTTAGVPPPNENQGGENAVFSGRSGINGNEDSKVLSEKKRSVYKDGFSKPGKNKRIGSTTPNFKKLHEARFKEMESIDQYVMRKKKHFKQRNLCNELKKQSVNKEVVATPIGLKGRLSMACTPASRGLLQDRAQGTVDQSSSCVNGSVKHSTFSGTKMNVRFSATTKDNEYKRSLTKTPARKSPHVTISGNTPKGQAMVGTKNLKTTKGNSATVITPLKLTAEAAQTPVSNRKPVFDLKASLSRPLTYEPHKGKLKPWGQSKENKYRNDHVNRVSLHKKTYKQPRFQTREEQRKKHEQERKERKAHVLGSRRGLVMAAD